MTARATAGWIPSLAFAASLLAGVAAPRTSAAQLPSPLSSMVVVSAPALGWGAIERRVSRGVRQGVASFRFRAADREDMVAVALERAWQAFEASDEDIEHPEAWGRTIATRVCLDALRRQRHDPLSLAVPVDDESSDMHGPVEASGFVDTGPFGVTARDEQRTLLRRRVDAWPLPERRLAHMLLDGQADTISAAAWRYRDEELARGEAGSMYPHKARTLLDARRRELEDLA